MISGRPGIFQKEYTSCVIRDSQNAGLQCQQGIAGSRLASHAGYLLIDHAALRPTLMVEIT
jgi:hypothetical protein